MKIDEVLAKYSEPTTYEKEKGLQHKTNWFQVKDCGDIKFFTRDAHDDTLTLLIVFRAGTTDNWCGWMINDPQAKTMIQEFPKLYKIFESYNDRVRSRKHTQ
jgi:hypothetical protein